MSDKETIENLKRAIEHADAIAKQKTNFLATMSHEIRTPMQTIYGLLELIAIEKPENNIASMVDTAQSAASGLLEILDDILDVAKMDADAMEIDTFEVPVRLLVRGMLEALSVKVRGSYVVLVDDIEDDVPFVVIGDPKRLRQILMNLCGNALKFTHEGHVTVRVTTQTQTIKIPDGGVGLRFEIMDTGIGMNDEACKKLFQSFSQADNSTSRKYGGTGLGLSISKKLVELMQGSIGVHSIEGEGSTFWFEIPTEEVNIDEERINLPNLEGVSVLCVEDHPQGAREIVSSLRSMGAKVEHCDTYASGKKLALQHPFDVAVIDQGLPDGLGINLIKEIQGSRPNIGMVMYTVRDDIGLSHSLNSLGATYLTKPASRAGLGEAVKNAAPKNIGIIDGPRRLLIAEDTASVRDILRRQLTKIGMEADFVTNGQEALNALSTGQYGILFTDLHMPEMDGYELVKIVRDTYSDFPTIALTADVQMAQRDAYMRHGFNECLLKPVTLGQMKGLLMRWRLLEDETAKAPILADIKTTSHATEESSLDLDCLIANLGVIDESTIEMMHIFVEMTEPLIEDIQKTNEKSDLPQLAELGHSLKGAARSACCNHLGNLAGNLQDLASANNDCTQVVEKIIGEFERAKDDIYSLKAE